MVTGPATRSTPPVCTKNRLKSDVTTRNKTTGRSCLRSLLGEVRESAMAMIAKHPARMSCGAVATMRQLTM